MPPALRGVVHSWLGYDLRTAPDAIHHGVPSTAMTLVISLDDPVDCGWLHDADTSHFDVLASGLHTRPALIRTHGRQHGLQLALSPLAARSVFGAPAGVLSGEILRAEDLGWPGDLPDRLRHATWPDRFALVERFLTTCLATSRVEVRPDVALAWETIRRRRGAVRVDELAHDTGLSRRRLSTLMTTETGLSPKQAARVARFEHARGLLLAGRRTADVATVAGYADQPHLSREWREFSGMTPSDSLRDFPNVHDS